MAAGRCSGLLFRNAGGVTRISSSSRSFDAIAVAEGIEKADDLRTLAQLGCDQDQDYLFAKPMILEEFTSMS